MFSYASHGQAIDITPSRLTVQEIGTMIRRGLKPFIFVLNNDGYEIERQIHGVTVRQFSLRLPLDYP